MSVWHLRRLSAMDEHSEPETERAHDVLAAEMYPVPAPDPILHRGPLALPDDLTGSAEARDVLAAEEFPMPAPPERPQHGYERARSSPWPQSVAVWALLILFAALSRRRRRTQRGS